MLRLHSALLLQHTYTRLNDTLARLHFIIIISRNEDDDSPSVCLLAHVSSVDKGFAADWTIEIVKSQWHSYANCSYRMRLMIRTKIFTHWHVNSVQIHRKTTIYMNSVFIWTHGMRKCVCSHCGYCISSAHRRYFFLEKWTQRRISQTTKNGLKKVRDSLRLKKEDGLWIKLEKNQLVLTRTSHCAHCIYRVQMYTDEDEN